MIERSPWTYVRRRTAVLEVTAAVSLSLATNTDTAAAVGDTVRELIDRGGLELAGEAELVALSVGRDVLVVLGSELVDRLLDLLEPSLLAHLLRREVRVAASAVPVALGDRLRVCGQKRGGGGSWMRG